jgi:hypothetical protein
MSDDTTEAVFERVDECVDGLAGTSPVDRQANEGSTPQ